MSPVSSHGWRIALLTVSADVVNGFHHVLRERGHELVAIVLPPGPDGSRPRHPAAWAPMMNVLQAAPPGADVLIAGQRDRLAPLLASARPDLLLSFFFPWRVRPEALAVAPLGAVNVHPSLLPRYRGPNPLGWTLRNHEPEVGMTLHRMDATFDTGPVLIQGTRPIDDSDSAEDVVRKVMELSMELLPEALSRVQWRDEGETQSNAEASYAGMFEDSYRELDWNAPAREVHLRVRACAVSSWRGVPRVAYASLEGRRVHIQRTRLAEEQTGDTAVPGTVLDRRGEMRLVRCGDGPLWVTPGSLDP
ncbi:methionyl-tRNA formyltransferase [Melittangium boletus]|uniref:Methionyl-tRNA formyltransferase n=1 Tax=Melittangium boletus DSM 14713 TaxID=1294270 RepID=A0A250I8C2_9BACT|nr:formyltransferase family protein [Melittangium boletus]ATB27206.1 methionyl-tRNA formyltransferase [Melittangium boletus DSM 14713]